MNHAPWGREWSRTAHLPCSHPGETQAGLCSLQHGGSGAGGQSQKLSHCCFSSYAPAVRGRWKSSHLLRDASNPHAEAKNRKANGAGTELGQGKQSSLPPPLHTGIGDFFSLASWFGPHSAQRAAQPRLLPPPSTGKLGCRGELGLGEKGCPGDCFQRAQSCQPRTCFGSAQQGCSPGSLSEPQGCIYPKGRAARGCISPRPGCPGIAAPLFASLPLFLPFKLL